MDLAPAARARGRALLLSVLALAGLVSAGPTFADAPPSLDFCFTPSGGTQNCYSTLAEAEGAMRASTPIGEFLYKYDESTNSTGSWTYRYYRTDKQEPEWHGIPGYRVGGWSPSDLGCTPSAYPGPGSEFCHDEGEAAALWTTRRAQSLGGSCHYYGGSLAGGLSTPTSLAGAYSGSRNGAANYPDHATPGGRHIAESWWCEGWGTPDPTHHKTGVFKSVPFRCPEGFRTVSPASDWPRVCLASTTYKILVRTSQVEGCSANANPCYPSTGEKRRYEPDFEFAGDTFVRTYRSRGEFAVGHMGLRWHHSYGSRIGSANGSTRFFVSADGSFLEIDNASTVDGIPHFRIRGLSDRAARKINGTYEVIDETGHTWVYHGTSGILLRRRHATNPAFDLEFGYQNGELASVVDGTGRELTFHYSSAVILLEDGGLIPANQYTRLLTEIVLPDGGIVEYRYDTFGNLVGVTRADGSERTYHYDEAAHDPSPVRGLMTGIADEGTRYATFTYDAYGRVKSSALAGDVERTELSYVSPTQVDVTTPNGDVRRYTFGTDIQRRLLSIQDGRGTRLNVYDTSGRRKESKSPAGVRTLYGYSNDLLATITEAAGNADERVTTLTRDTLGRTSGVLLADREGTALVTKSRSAITRDASGRVTAACAYDPGSPNGVYVCGSAVHAPAGVRQTTFAYCTAEEAAVAGSVCPLVGQLKRVDGPRTDVEDAWTYEYRPADELSGCLTGGACHRRGDLWKLAAPDGRATLFERNDLAGRASRIRDANQVVADIEYDTRGRVTARKVRGSDDTTDADDATTWFEYDGVGQVARVTQPDGSFVLFDYDDAHRLTGIEDALGNTIAYRLDGAGNRFKEETRDVGGVLRLTLDRLFNQLGELETAADAYANPTDFTYDATGQVDTVTDALGRTTDNDHDALGRLRQSIANVAGTGGERAVSQFGYDALDNLTTVIDPKGLTTQYVYDGLGNLAALQSPDTGTSSYGYDSAGNRIRQLDARGIESIYTYDRLNRLTSIDLPTAGQDVALGYDALPAACQAEETYSIGRLSTIVDASGGTTYCYDRRGNVVRKIQAVTGGPGGVVGYSYNHADAVVAMTYPSGAVVAFSRDATGRITGVTAQPTAGSSAVTVISGVDYEPFGPIREITFGNGRSQTRTRDQNYGIDHIGDSAVGTQFDYTLDDVGNVVGLSEKDAAGSTVTRGVQYDGLDRLKSLRDGGVPVQSFTYDATGNRQQKVSGTTADYTYPVDSHRLTNDGVAARTYDAAGHGTGIGARTFTYDDSGRRAQYFLSGTLKREYRYNGRGERVAKVDAAIPSNDRFFVYNEAGQLLGEYMADGSRVREYLWMDDVPVAVLVGTGTTVHYVLSDHLNTPRAIVNRTTNATIWRWDLTTTAFGEHAANSDPDGDGVAFTYNLRYPGQYYDGETGLHYNYFRDYDPETGRYLQSDPIGLAGGSSTFGYVGSSSFGSTDSMGLMDSVRMGCIQHPDLCMDLLGEYSRGQAVVQRALGNCDAADYYEAAGLLVDSARPLIAAVEVASVVTPVGAARRSVAKASNASDAFHYTYSKYVDSISKAGLRPGSFATNSGRLSPLQAQIELALPANRGLPNAMLRIDLAALRAAGFEIPALTRVSGRFGLPGGGMEMQFPYSIPPQFIEVIP